VNETNSCPQSLARGFIVSLVSAALFGAIADAVFHSAWMLPWDARIGSWFHSFQSRTVTNAMVLVSLFGDPRLLFVSSLGLAGVLLYLSFWRELFTAGVILAGGAVLHLILKSAFHRARPDDDWLTAVQGYSFPSGHALGAVLFYGTLAYLVVRLCRMPGDRPVRRYLFVSVCAAVVFWVGVSRVYLGVHFLSDVLGGWSAGVFWLSLCLASVHRLRPRPCPM
jgi:undecaprenyl-diphosphatase